MGIDSTVLMLMNSDFAEELAGDLRKMGYNSNTVGTIRDARARIGAGGVYALFLQVQYHRIPAPYH